MKNKGNRTLIIAVIGISIIGLFMTQHIIKQKTFRKPLEQENNTISKTEISPVISISEIHQLKELKIVCSETQEKIITVPKTESKLAKKKQVKTTVIIPNKKTTPEVHFSAPISNKRPFATPVTTNTVIVPASIDATGKTVVSIELNAFIDTVPDGSIISFPAGSIYLLKDSVQAHDIGSIFISDRHNLIFEGNGAILKIDSAADGSSAYTSPFMIGDTPSHPNSDIVIRDFVLVGNSPTPGVYDSSSQGQSSIHICGATRLEICNITSSGSHADFVDSEYTNGLWVHDCHVITAGRNSISIEQSGSNILVENCVFEDSGYCVFDIEPATKSNVCTDITFRNNIAGTWGTAGVCGGGLFLGIEGSHSGATIDRITIDNNSVTGGSLRTNCDNGGTAGTRMAHITFINNKGIIAEGPILYFAHVDGLTVSGNVQPISSEYLMYIADCTKIIH